MMHKSILFVVVVVLFNVCNAASANVVNGKQDALLLPNDGTCTSAGHSATCCVGLDIPQIKCNGNLCFNATYIPSALGFLLSFTFNGEVIYQVSDSLQNPDVCFPYLGATFCVDFTNMKYSTTQVSGCADLKVTFLGFKIFSVSMGCFTIDISS